MLKLNEISYQYPKQKEFSLKKVSLDVRPGEVFTLLGPNGAGKTTLIRILSGLILPKSGKVEICGYDISKEEYKARANIGLVLGDERTFYFRLSGRQNLEFFGGLYGLDRRSIKPRIDELLVLVGLNDNADKKFMKYSSGMRKKLNIARALLHKPQVLLLDEPTTSVDPESTVSIRNIIYDLKKQGKTILMATHDMDEADRIADRIGFLKNGELLKIGTVADFKNLIKKKSVVLEFDSVASLTDKRVEMLINDISELTSFERIEYQNKRLQIFYNGTFNINSVFKVLNTSDIKVNRANTLDTSLEDVFITLAG